MYIHRIHVRVPVRISRVSFTIFTGKLVNSFRIRCTSNTSPSISHCFSCNSFSSRVIRSMFSVISSPSPSIVSHSMRSRSGHCFLNRMICARASRSLSPDSISFSLNVAQSARSAVIRSVSFLISEEKRSWVVQLAWRVACLPLYALGCGFDSR